MKSPLIAVVGETASGKSALAMELAQRFDGELVCADSWTVYRGFDIGTAKPSVTDQRLVPHHLLDIADPEQGFSAAEFQRLARAAIADILARGKLPVLVGGTGLYVDSVLFDYTFMPAPADGLRDQLSSLSLEELLSKAKAASLDMGGIDLRNKRRIIRLIENDGARPARGGLRPETLLLGIVVDRDQLRVRVVRRVDAMLAAGLETEVRRLASRYGWEVEPMKGIGYREWQPYLQADGYGPGSRQTLEQTRERIIAATMGLAKRQRTWFKRNERIHWLHEPNTMAESVDLVTSFIYT